MNLLLILMVSLHRLRTWLVTWRESSLNIDGFSPLIEGKVAAYVGFYFQIYKTFK